MTKTKNMMCRITRRLPSLSLRLLRRACLVVASFMLASTMFSYYTHSTAPRTYLFHQTQNEKNTTTKYLVHTLEERKEAGPPTLAVLFTTFTSSPQKAQLFSNTVKNWAAFIPHIRPILFTTDKNSSLNTLAESHGWMVVPCPKLNKHSTPFLKDMYLAAYKLVPELPFYGFVNGDIMFSHSMLTTLRRLVLELPVLNTTLVSGRRFDYNIPGNERFFNVWSPQNISALLRARRNISISRTDTEDYFFVTRDFPWNVTDTRSGAISFKDVVIGRPGYDNYLVARSRQLNLTTVDVTSTMLALHQSGHFKDRTHLPGGGYNKEIIGNFNYYDGLSDRMWFRTELDYKGDVSLKKGKITDNDLKTYKQRFEKDEWKNSVV